MDKNPLSSENYFDWGNSNESKIENVFWGF